MEDYLNKRIDRKKKICGKNCVEDLKIGERKWGGDANINEFFLGLSLIALSVGAFPLAAAFAAVNVGVLAVKNTANGLFRKATAWQKKRLQQPIFKIMKYFKDKKDANYDLKKNTYHFHKSGKNKCKIVYVQNSLLYIYDTKTKNPIFKSLKGENSLQRFDEKTTNWYEKDFVGTTVSEHSSINKNILVGFWFRNAIIYMDGKKEVRIYDKGLKKFKATVKRGKLSVTFPEEWKNEDLVQVSSKVETTMIEATEAFKAAGKRSKFQKLSNKQIKKNNRNNPRKTKSDLQQKMEKQRRELYKAELLKKGNNPVNKPAFDPLPFLGDIQQKEHKVYKNLRY